ncbi:MAG TPA: N-acyl homoserine lactonase family protein [Pseudolabrys sp.]|nr:N-acyl homoserine lactonase family protein [Pseudolabrys sp.]
MKMHFLSGGRLRMRKAIFLPGVEKSATIELPIASVLLRHAQGNVLFDTGCHPSVASPAEAEARWGTLARVMTPIMGKDDNVLAGLSGLGMQADDIDVVICSHLHADHCGCNAFFKKATLIVHARELEAARADDAQAQGFFRADWDHPMPIDTVNAERDVFGDGRITLLPLPGHTPGTMSALVQLERSGAFLLASDTVSLRETLDDGVMPKHTWNAEVLAKSLVEVRRIAAQGATIICSHDDRQWQTLRKGADAYD